MEFIPLDTIKRLWKNKITQNFDAGKESFNLYIDSPFCIGPICRFCCFETNILDVIGGGRLKERYYNKILIKNIRDFQDILSLRCPDTVYFGGGSSSLMSVKQMENIFSEFQTYFDFKHKVKEKTFELHPSQVTKNKIDLLDKWKFTHVTLGVQTFNNKVLKHNNRSNPSLERLIEIFTLFQEKNFQYNMDLMTFIFRENTLEDLQILRQDLEIATGILKPCRITIFPNYFQLLDMENPLKPKDHFKSPQHVFKKIGKLRVLLKKFENGEYEYIGSDSQMVDFSNYRLNYYLVKRGYFKDITYNCSGWNDPACREFIKNQNVMAFGGYRQRKPYSYISDRFCYNTIITEDRQVFELVFLDRRF